jgi:hypothetical protein
VHLWLLAGSIWITAATMVSGAPAGAREAPLLAGYAGAFFGSDSYKRYLPLLRDHGFNAVDLKVHPADFDMNSPEMEAFLTEVVREARAHGLRVLLYLYPEKKGQRDPASATAGPYVGDDGTMHERMYCLYQEEAWLSMFRRVFYLARLSRTLPIEAVKIDIEININTNPCYCDDCWRTFDGASGAHDLPASRRKELLRWSGKEKAYLAHLESRLDRAVIAYRERAHRENPRLRLGMMPARDDLLSRAFARHLATKEAPAYLDNWTPYDGLGWREEVAAARDRLKALNPHNRFIPWFRINRYRPGDLPAHTFALATQTDGYNLWTLSMIHPEEPPRGPGYALPPEHRDVMAYWRAFGEANAAVGQWLAQPTGFQSPFALKPIQPLAPGLDLEGITVPALKPLGPRDTGRPLPAPSTYRGRTLFYLYVPDPAVPIKARIRHQAGKQRNEPIAYAIIDSRGVPLTDDLIQPGETATVTRRAPEAGVYALLVEASEGGGPWYDVSIPEHPYVVGGKKEVYFFRGVSRQYFLVPEGTASFRIHFATGGQHQQARLQLFNSRDERVLDETLVSEQGAKKRFEVKVALEEQGKVWSLLIGRPETMPSPYYSENYYLRLEGIPSYFSDRPDGLLMPR